MFLLTLIPPDLHFDKYYNVIYEKKADESRSKAKPKA
jgi:hypothetical protein